MDRSPALPCSPHSLRVTVGIALLAFAVCCGAVAAPLCAAVVQQMAHPLLAESARSLQGE